MVKPIAESAGVRSPATGRKGQWWVISLRLLVVIGGGYAASSALVAGLFREVLFRGRVFFDRDVHLLWYPQAQAFVRSIAEGSWPVWNPRATWRFPVATGRRGGRRHGCPGRRADRARRQTRA